MFPSDGMTVSSGADLVNSVPADIFSGIDSGSESTETPETGGDIDSPGTPDESVETEEVPEETQLEDEPAEEPVPEEAEPEPEAEAKPVDELPDGVRRGKDSKGKDGLFVEPKRWETIYGDHKAVRQYSEMLGEPLTADALDVRHRAFLGQEKLYSDLLSADPKSQALVLNHFLEEGARALQKGEVGTDPIVSLTDTFYQTLQEKHPDAYAGLRTRAAADLVQELYSEAQKEKSVALFQSAGWVAKTLGMAYKKDGEMQQWFASSPQENPLSAAQQRIQQLESQLNGRQVDTQAAQLEQWKTGTRQTVTAAVLNDAVMPSLAEYQTGLWGKNPEYFQELVVDPLHKEVRDALVKDKGFNERIAMLDKSAARGVSAQRREAIAGEIKQAYVNRARLAADALRPQRLKAAAELLKGRSDATHKRLQSAQNQRGPKGAASPVPRSLVPNNLLPKAGDVFDAAEQARLAAQLIG